MPRVAQRTIRRSWVLSITLSVLLAIFTLIFLYVPFLEKVNDNTICQQIIETIENKSSCIELTVLDVGILNIQGFQFTIPFTDIPIFDILDLTLITIVSFFIIPAYYYRKDYVWRTKADSYLPFLLREISDAQKVGLPLPRAVIEASKRQYGPLTEELKKMAAKLSWGIPFATGLRSMQRNINTPLFDRTAILILEAEKSGGETADIFDSAYLHVTELLGLQRERLSAMAPYKWIIIVAFLVFSFVIIILLNTFFAQLAQQSAEFESNLNNLNDSKLGGLDISLATLQVLFYHMLIIEGFFSGLIAAKMSTGNIRVGLSNSLILLFIAWFISKIGVITL